MRLSKTQLPTGKKLTNIAGQMADGGALDDDGTMTATVVGGTHDGHHVTISTAKHNCGAYDATVQCSCGARYESAMHGCWQNGHQRDESGDDELRQMLTLEYEFA